MKSKKRGSKQLSGAKSWIGQPVCMIMKDGSYYVGIVEGQETGELILSGFRGEGRLLSNSDEANRAQVSGFLGSLFGGGAGAGLGSGLGGILGGFGGAGPTAGRPSAAAGTGATAGIGGFLGGIMPKITLGMNMIKMIMPLMQFFKV